MIALTAGMALAPLLPFVAPAVLTPGGLLAGLALLVPLLAPAVFGFVLL